jgi:EAL domain-containing protein (putative c-di-GMP-specific phosphodiesterase class I)
VARPDAIGPRPSVGESTVSALRHAIAGGELRLFFQPIVRLDDARCVGAEALVRWQHPARGLVSPGELLPLAEAADLMVPLGEWVLEHAVAQAARWQLEQPDFVVSVNLCARELAAPGLADRVATVLEHHGVAPSNLCVDIAGQMLTADSGAARSIIHDLCAVGVAIALDDFGTGCTSSADLERLAVDAVKIDRAFVADLVDDPGDRAVVAAVVGLAHSLGRRAVAAGVETEAQLRELLALGCDEAQGYFFAPPQPAADLRALVSAARRWRPPGSRLMDGP